MKALSTDSSIQAKYGTWGSKADGSLETDSEESTQRVQVTDNGLKISFQALQIIEWVSEILPQSPRSSDPGGMTDPPNKVFC
ncbi:hypothetical protein P153DRAFT_387590 [Dothidotthia symphoricarpi CBS 119687]|uniref:Uncharacterized protein n=1 Tax=Dothidotthia symphoricarpi CBS 119687 TaxID=1392245 RepID=A0A6A6A4X3_9PLEO|nr:uncharacterized protein P153DRAFT_387590 [Dothidotthia symphoricarpi CBS 119687]KAF2127042.1 hypothetical protein P153DRAFT_387590 [Dothidotthia symphoricarpi CBS 119687]